MPKRVIGTDEHQSMYRQFLVKSKDWEYEKEYRVLSTNLGPGIHPFDQNLRSGVIAGIKISKADLKILEAEITKLQARLHKDIHFSQAEMVQGKYKINLKLKKNIGNDLVNNPI